MVTILGREVPNQLNELTVLQFEQITNIHANNELDAIAKHLEVFELLGVPEVDFEDVSIEEFKECVKVFNDLSGKPELQQSIEMEGYTYKAFEGDTFRLSVKDTKHIEKVMHSKHKGYIAELLAILFKREDLTKAEHYAEAHIKHKAKMIRELKAELAVPYLVEIGQKLAKQMPKDAPAEVVE
jgi:hypothetical protein